MKRKMNLLLIFLIYTSLILLSHAQNAPVSISIRNYPNQYVHLVQCYGDSLIFIDSIKTDKQGKAQVAGDVFLRKGFVPALYRVYLPYNQWFYILYDGKPIQLRTVFQFHAFSNIATDSVQVFQSDENKRLYEFIRLQKQLNVANYHILQMMRWYPLTDPFHKQLENEYLQRYQAMDNFVKKVNPKKSQSFADKIVVAYYPSVNPDWKQPDPWRDSIIAVHFFDKFNPADSFYLYTDILPDKIDAWLRLPLNNTPTSTETPAQKEDKTMKAADVWLQKVSGNAAIAEWSLQYLFKVFEKQKYYDAMYYIYDKYVQSRLQDCEPPVAYKHLHEKIATLKNIQIGSPAPDILIYNRLSLYSIPADYTLLLFWATWCPHCIEEVPKIRDVVNEVNAMLAKQNKRLQVIAISLDTDKEAWENFVNDNQLQSFINYSEFQGWQSPTAKLYHVYATPTMFLLNKEKKIIAKPENASQLISILMSMF